MLSENYFCLTGVCRLCAERVVNVDSLVDGEECWLSNGKKGFIWGKIKLHGWQAQHHL